MLNSISISNFKAIGETPLVLNELAKVNYLVGPNGCGKSKIIKSLFYNYWKQNQQNLQYVDNTILSSNLTDNLSKIEVIFDLFYVSKTEIKQEIPNLFFLNNFNTQNRFSNTLTKEAEDFTKYKYYQIQSDKNDLVKVENLKKVHECWNNLVSKIKTENNIYNELKTIDVFYKDHPCGREPDGQGISELKDFIEVIFSISALAKPELLIIEEPLLHSHPKLQKVLPFILKCIHEITKIQFIISTHSPFIISAAAEFGDSQKVYLIENGQTVDLERKNTERSKLGYSGGEAIIASSQILGAGLEDIFGKNLIFCEKSFSEFLNSFVKTHNLKANLTFITAGGDNAIIDQADIMGQILKNFTLYSESKIKFGMQTWAIFDTNSQLNNQKNQQKIQKIKDSDCKVIQLEKEELELFYPIEIVNDFLAFNNLSVWKKEGFSTFQKYLKEKNIKESFPNIKNELADFIGSKVDKEFVKEFSTELYELLYD